VLSIGIILGLVLGLLAGGSLVNLASVRLRWVSLIAAAVVIRFGTEAALIAGLPLAETLRVPLLAASFGILLVGLWANRSYPGLTLAFVGILSNGLVIVVNGGYMPIWEPSLVAAGLTPADVSPAIHTLYGPELGPFLLHLGPFADIIPIPFPLIQNVASIGDVFLTAGLALFLFASIVRVPSDLDDEAAARIGSRVGAVGGSGSGLSPAFAETAALERQVVLGGRRGGLASPALATIPVQRVEVAERIRRHPYVRLALNGSFSALWVGQLISLFGDRIHQVALTALVFVTTGSPVAAGLSFFFAALPNLFLSPLAGTFVDRWDRKEVLIVSDILRAAVVLLIPIAAIVNVVLVYPMIFAVTSISIFFRPARVAILPQLVEDDELVTANSALWIGETIADVLSFPIAGLFVVFLSSALPLAFWLDAVTYLASAVLLATIVVRPPAARPVAEQAAASDPAQLSTGFMAELKAGWRFLRGDTTLLANTIQAAVAQIAVGLLLAITSVWAIQVFSDLKIGWEGAWGLVEAGSAAGNILGGFAIGLVGARILKGRLIIAGYTVWGFLTIVLALSSSLPLAVGISFGAGIANMAFIIPSQALFQQRTPANLMGRVVSFRFALVFGSMTLAMGVGSIMTAFVSAATVIALGGLIAMIAGLSGLFVPALRDA
jgi:MFS family permease